MNEQERILQLFQGKPRIINLGIDTLVDHLEQFDVKVVKVEWTPPAGGNLEILKKLRQLQR